MVAKWADMFDLDAPGTTAAEWTAADLRAMWRHQLAVRLPGGSTVGAVLHAQRPRAADVEACAAAEPAQFATVAPDSLPPPVTAALSALYAAARTRASASDESNGTNGAMASVDQVDASLAQPWLDDESRQHLTRFREALSAAGISGGGAPGDGQRSRDAGREPDAPDANRRGRYEIERPHASGGLGVLSVARDVDLGRAVALKEIRPELRDDPGSRQRFVREAQIAGTLEHPNIVPVYALGRDARGNPYYAMRFVGGRTLERAIAEHHRAPSVAGLRDLLRRFGDVCRAMAYAHSRGIVHRDLKPLNVMLGDFGETWIVDWGIAKRVADAGAEAAPDAPAAAAPASPAPAATAGHTLAGQSLGTPRYMSPEQRADASRAGPLSDVFSLGAILSQIVTGRPPHPDPQTGVPRAGASASSPSANRRRLGRDVRALRAIAARAMSAAPADRYADAAELAAEVERWLADEPVRAYDEPLLNALFRWTRRHRAAVVAGVLLLLSSAVVLGLGMVRVRGERDEKERALRNATESAEAARRSERTARERLVTTLRLTGENLMGQGNAAAAAARYREALAVTRELGLGDTGLTCALLDSYIRSPRPLAVERRAVLPVAAPTHPEPDVLLAGDGRTVIYGEVDGSVVWLDLATGVELARRPGHAGGVRALALSEDGGTLLTGGHDGTIAAWDARARRELRRIPGAHAAPVRQVALTRDGGSALSAGDDGRVKWWDVAAGRERNGYPSRSLPEHVENVAFTPDGTGGVAACHGGQVVVWDLATGQVRRAINADAACASAAFLLGDADVLMALGGSGALGLWTYPAGVPAKTLSSHERTFSTISLSRAAGLVLGVSHGGLLATWDLAGQPLHTHGGVPAGGAVSAGLSDDGLLVSTALKDGSISLWSMAHGAELGLLHGHRGRVLAGTFSPDGRLAASAAWDGTVRAWDVATGREIRRFGPGAGSAAGNGDAQPHQFWSVAFAPDADTLYAGDANGVLTAWSLSTGAQRFRVPAHVKPSEGATRPTAPVDATDIVTGIALSPDGRLLATSGAEQTVKLWDARSGAHLRTLIGHTHKVRAVTFAPDGRHLLSAGYDHVVRIWDTATWRQVGELAGHAEKVNTVAVSSDGRTAATGSFDGELKIWDLSARRAVHSISAAHKVSTAGVSFAPDGRTVASCGEDGLVRLWDVSGAAELHHFAHHGAATRSVAFSPDGTKLLSASFDGNLHVHDLSRPAAYERFEAELAAARAALRSNPGDAAALATVGRWFSFRGQHAIAADLLERAAAAGADVSALTLARHYWQLGRTEAARTRFREASERGEAPAAYLALCADAAGR